MGAPPLTPIAGLRVVIAVESGTGLVDRWEGTWDLCPPMLFGSLHDTAHDRFRDISAWYTILPGGEKLADELPSGLRRIADIASGGFLTGTVSGLLTVALPRGVVEFTFEEGASKAVSRVPTVGSGVVEISVHLPFKKLAEEGRKAREEAHAALKVVGEDKRGEKAQRRSAEARIRLAAAELSLGNVEGVLTSARHAVVELREAGGVSRNAVAQRADLVDRLELLAPRHPHGGGLLEAANLLRQTEIGG